MLQHVTVHVRRAARKGSLRSLKGRGVSRFDVDPKDRSKIGSTRHRGVPARPLYEAHFRTRGRAGTRSDNDFLPSDVMRWRAELKLRPQQTQTPQQHQLMGCI